MPSTAKRTALIGAVASAPILPGTYFLYRYAAARPGEITPEMAVIGIVAWSLLAVGSTAVTSRVIYGLRREARAARQLGQYTLDAKIGEGGMGVVYRASHAMLRRPTAIKLLSADRGGPADARRFEREVQLTSQLTHPNTIAIYDYGRTGDGVFYYAMEYLDGVDLETLVRLDGPQPPERVIHILHQIAGALADAHDVGLIHRDVKPANALICNRGGMHDVVKVLDFGLVKSVDPEHPGASLTQETALAGTPLYLSPEAISTPKEIDARSDLYALGAVGYFLLTGRPPFEGATVVEVCSHHLMTRPVPPSERLEAPLPEDLEALVLRCLEKEREDRPASAAAICEALERCRDSEKWGEARAAAWWSANAEKVRRAREREAELAAGTDGLAGASTVLVDGLRLATLG